MNDHPSLNIVYDTSSKAFGRSFNRNAGANDICPVDLHVKTHLLGDTIKIA